MECNGPKWQLHFTVKTLKKIEELKTFCFLKSVWNQTAVSSENKNILDSWPLVYFKCKTQRIYRK